MLGTHNEKSDRIAVNVGSAACDVMQKYLGAFAILILGTTSGCALPGAERECEPVTALIEWEFARSSSEELVFSTIDDGTFDVSWRQTDEFEKALIEWSEGPWLNLSGRSPWSDGSFSEIEKTHDEIVLMRSLLAQASSPNAVPRCVALREVLNDHEVAFGEDAVNAVSAIVHPQGDGHSKAVAAVYLPVLSKDGQSALLFASRTWGPLGGVGLIIKVERQANDQWLPTRAQVVWVA